MQYCTLVHTIKMSPEMIANISSTQATPRRFPEEKFKWFFKCEALENSLAVQRIGLHALLLKAWVQSLVRELISHKAAWHSQKRKRITFS